MERISPKISSKFSTTLTKSDYPTTKYNTMKQRFKVSFKMQTNGEYYFSDYIYCKSMKTINRTKGYKHFMFMLNNGIIAGFKIEMSDNPTTNIN